MRFVLDTSVVSQTTKAQPHSGVLQWWGQRDESELTISAVTVHELRYGIELLDEGARRRGLEAWLTDLVLPDFAGKILPIDQAVADLSGRLLAERKKNKETAEINDMMIAATAIVHGLQVATLNRGHFERLGVELVEF
ncbi:MAG TPA: PIN domain-containing protein [Acidobacteriaceae bacterium]|nr:PIN domain-containing protein [Acidobacteriaceae bacterium]